MYNPQDQSQLWKFLTVSDIRNIDTFIDHIMIQNNYHTQTAAKRHLRSSKTLATIERTSPQHGVKQHFLPDYKLHRLDGPAVEYPNGRVEWHIDGVQVADLNSFIAIGKECDLVADEDITFLLLKYAV